ncbi:MAG: prolyl-tRNA synthetase associated domain-containing protein [Ruminococcaceae bacterium]|nr:prolyl-tRNA synthetase associated domain-containing protein [Oscillospiraceae bacterium]
MELSNKRPDSPRSEVEEKTYDCLEKLGIPFERVDHEPAETIEKCLEIDKVLGTEICKNLLLCNRQQTAFYLLLLPGQKVFKTKDLSAQIGSARLSFASGELMEELLSTSPGSLSVLSLLFDRDKEVRLLIDRELTEMEYWGMHPCKNTTSLKIKRTDILDKFLPSVLHSPTFVTL